MSKRFEYTVEEEKDCGISVSSFLKQKGFSKREISNAKFYPEGILRNGEKTRVSTILERGDLVSVFVADRSGRSEQIVSCEQPPVILYEDQDFLIADKPAGMAVHPSGGHLEKTLANSVAGYLRKKGEETSIRAVGRLDLETSGAVIFAKNRVAAARLSVQKGSDSFQKEYLAVCHGIWETKQGKIDLDMRKRENTDRMECCSEGMKAITFYEVQKEVTAENEASYSVVRVRIVTGRTHQIRCHFSECQHPLLGDVRYGGSTSLINRTALHANRLTFTHPFTGEVLTVDSEPPEDIVKLLN